MVTTNTNIETVNTGADKAKVAAAALLIVGGVVAYYYLANQNIWTRLAALLGLIGAGVVVFFLSDAGKRLIAFGRDSYKEVLKVVWPARNEALQMTGYVFAFVVVMALFLWVTDKTIEYVLYDLLLGWRK